MKYYLPEDERREDAKDIYESFWDIESLKSIDRLCKNRDPESAARSAAKNAFDDCDGLETYGQCFNKSIAHAGETPACLDFKLTVIGDEGEEYLFEINVDLEPVFYPVAIDN